ncbi:Fc.00g107080.m01.CDS01 [Cosmosporella sp. VM-42]
MTPVQGVDVPMVPTTKTELLIATSYRTEEVGPSKLSLLISGYRSPPTLNVTIIYNGGWEFSATASNIHLGSLVSLFGGEVEQADAKEMLGHLILETLQLKYTSQKSTVSMLSLTAIVLFKACRFELKYSRQAGDKDAGWMLTMDLTQKKSTEKVKLASILQWLLGESVDDYLPDFLSASAVDLADTHSGMSLTQANDQDKSTLALPAHLNIGDLAVQFARIQVSLANFDKAVKPPAKTLIRVSVNRLLRPPPLPLVGQIGQPFSVDLRWANSDLSIDDINNLNKLPAFKQQKLLLSDNAKQDAACGQGVSFALLADGKVVIGSRPKKTKKKSDQPSDKTATVLVDDGSEPTETKAFPKRINGVPISNLGLGYDTNEQKIKIKFSARATLGPLDGELANFAMGVRLPRNENGRGIHLGDWNNLKIDMGLEGLALGMTGSSLSTSGFLQRVHE